MEELLEKAYALLKSCKLCPRACAVDRLDGPNEPGRRGYCGQTAQLKVAYVGPHMGEEPPISGTNGSGTVFLTGCGLRCSYCQNYQISHEGIGVELSVQALSERIDRLIRSHRVHNINFVTPDHFFPHVLHVIWLIREAQNTLPIVMNCSGYQSIETLRLGKDFFDIYLPDFKYADAGLATRLSGCPDYAEVALTALEEMLRQKGFLRVSGPNPPLGTMGVLVRHLILPGHTENSCEALTMLFVEFGPRLPVSLMSQYYPVRPQRDPLLNRTVTKEEFDRVLRHARDLGFESLYVQFPEQLERSSKGRPRFVPDFTSPSPFD